MILGVASIFAVIMCLSNEAGYHADNAQSHFILYIQAICFKIILPTGVVH